MFGKTLAVVSTLALAALILLTSVFRSASVKYAFSQSPEEVVVENGEDEKIEINYFLPYPGKILPDSPLWPLKALRDRLWLMVTTNTLKKAELKLLFADKRLGSSKMLFEKEKPEIAFTTLSKGEKYLEGAFLLEEEARVKGIDTSEFLTKLVNASLKHREVIDGLLVLAPADAKPEIIKIRDYCISVYNKTRDTMYEKGMEPPENPFDSS